MKLRKIISLALTMAMLLTMMPFTVVAEDGEAVADLTISTVEELQNFAENVNNGNSYSGKTVVLKNDINLMDDNSIIADMSPIGTKDNPFKGTFDGQGHTVYNLYIAYYTGEDYADTDYVGLFGFISSPAVVKNVTVDNPFLVGRSNVGGIVGCAYTGTIDNCHVTGEIDIEGYYKVGGITGYGYAKISDCSVIGDEDFDYNTIAAQYSAEDYEGDNVGGIVGMLGEGNIAIENCSVANVSIEGTRKVGGIVGSAFQNNTITGCSVSDVTVATNATVDYASDNASSMGIGGIVGLTSSTYEGGTITNCSVSDVTFGNENGVTVSAGAITGGHRGTDAPVAPDSTTIVNNTVDTVDGESNSFGIPAPTGTVTPAYAREEKGYVRVWGEGAATASESFVLELYSGETKIATTVLNNVGNIIDGDVNVTWNFYYPSSNDEYWTTTWEAGHPNSAAQPTKVVLYADGKAVAENVAKMSAPDNLNPVEWANLGGVQKIVTGLAGSGTAEDPFLINNLAELKWFRDDVNTYTSDGSNQYTGKYVKLTADIDLANENWTPIGTNSVGDHMAFLGTFYGEKADGTIPTISNLYVNADGGYLGFFARVGSYSEGISPAVKNLNFNNVDVSSNTTTSHNGSYIGGVIANAGGNSVVSGITVTGDVYVAGYGYIGGIVGHGYPDIDKCHVSANEGSYINCYYWCVGGIIGYAGEGGTPITNCSVSGVDIWSAYGGAGAVAGLLQDGNKLENVSASDVKVTSNSDYCMGYIAGNGKESTMTDITITNVTATANGVAITSTDAVAKIGDEVYFTLASALAAAKDDDVVIELLADATLDITAWETLAIGRDTAKSITINGNGKTLTFNKLDSDWNHITTKNDAKLILNDMTITDSGYNDGPWNRYDLVFACDVELNNVTSTKALAFKADATLNDVEITETGDNYAIWIQPNGQTVAIDGLTVTSAGRGIKIDNQYVDNAAKVTLSVKDATFTTAKKAAILVKTPAGADITLSNVDISNVNADTVNAVWNDEDNAAYFDEITVTGGKIAQEGAKADGKTIDDGLVIVNAFSYTYPIVSFDTTENLYRVAMIAAMDSDVYTRWFNSTNYAYTLGFEITANGETKQISVERPYNNITIEGILYEKDEAYKHQFYQVVAFGTEYAGKDITIQAYMNLLDGTTVYSEPVTVSF